MLLARMATEHHTKPVLVRNPARVIGFLIRINAVVGSAKFVPINPVQKFTNVHRSPCLTVFAVMVKEKAPAKADVRIVNMNMSGIFPNTLSA